MLMSKNTYGNMRMNVSQLFHELVSLNIGCHYNGDKEDIKEVSAKSMKYLMKSLKNEELKKEPITSTNLPVEEKAAEKTNEQQTIDELQKDDKREREVHNFIPYPDHNYGQQPPQTPPKEQQPSETSPKEQQPLQIPLKEQPPSQTAAKEKTEVDSPTVTNSNILSKNLVKEKVARITTNKQTEEFEGITTCICGFSHDDGFMISCDNCSSWQHIECMGIKSSKVPETYLCHTCFPRELDVENAKLIQSKKKENMSDGEDDDDDDGNEETEASEDEASKQPLYTAISNTPTRITLFTNSQNSTQPEKPKSRRSSRVQKRKSCKMSEQKNMRRKSRKKEKTEDGSINCFTDINALQAFINQYCSYEEIEDNQYEGDFKNMHFNLPETVPAIDFKKAICCHKIDEIEENRKGIIATCDIPSGNYIWEYKGVLLPYKRFEETNIDLQKSCPYVIYYSKIDNMPLVIDARSYGNDMRYIRSSCSPNSDLQHISVNGVLHILVISKIDIEKGKEITIPFGHPFNTYKGYVECACTLDNCVFKKIQLNDTAKLNVVEEKVCEIDATVLEAPSTTSKLENEHALESESESLPGCDDSKNERTLSREERKLQAYLKQFEKLEKKQEVGKKVKEARTPVPRTSTDESHVSIIPNAPLKTPVTKKTATAKRKMSMSSKRRTRQSSCSSEPVSPVDQDSNHSNVSTPNTPIASSSSTLDVYHLMKNKNKKEKEPITLTLPIQRKMKAGEQSNLLTPTPPSTPANHLSPVKSNTSTPGSLSISVDTTHTSAQYTTVEMVSQLKQGFTGLLQIAHNRNLLSPRNPYVMSSSGVSTSDERIGDVTFRQHAMYPAFATSTWRNNFETDSDQPKYFGSMKKYWLKKYNSRLNKTATTLQSSSSTSAEGNSSKQVSIAGLASSTSMSPVTQEQATCNSSTSRDQVLFKKPKSCVPLKKRYLMSFSKANTKLNQSTHAQTKNENTVPKNPNSYPEKSDRNPMILNSVDEVKHCDDQSNKEKDSLSITTANSEKVNNRTETVNTSSLLSSNNKESLNKSPSSSVNSLKRPIIDTVISESDFAKRQKISDSEKIKLKEVSENTETISSVSISNNKNNMKEISDSSNTSIVVTPTTLVSQSASVITCSVPTSFTNAVSPKKLVILNTDSKNTTPQPSPRSSSIDSNPDSESGILSGGEQVIVKKKLSFKEYRSRQRSQKNQPNNPSSSATTSYSQEKASSHTSTNAVPSNSDSSKLVIDSQTEKDNTEESRTINKYSTTSYAANLPSKTIDDIKYSFDDMSATSTSNATSSKLERSSHSSDSMLYEPVSPGDDEKSHLEESKRVSHTTIHTEITKNPFTIHNDITKNPFGRKSQGLLQYLSAQKYPHLVSTGGVNNAVTNPYRPPHEQAKSEGGVHINESHQSSAHLNQHAYSNIPNEAYPNEKPGSYNQRPRDAYTRDNYGVPPVHMREYYQDYHGYGNVASTNYSNFTESTLSTTQYGMPQHRRSNSSNYSQQSSGMGSNTLPRQQHRSDRYLPY